MTDRSVIVLGLAHGAIMKAAVIDTLGAAPQVIAYPDPSPATGDLVLVKVEAAALNAVDVHIASGHHRAGPPRLPYVPAVEAVGTIVAGPDQGLRVRAAVPAGLVNGGMAEFLQTSRATCAPVPKELDSVAAAAIGVVGTSAELSLRKAGIQAGDSVLVLGATGPLGTAVIQLARLAGAKRVIAAGRNPERLAQVPPAADGVVLLGEEPLPDQLASLGGLVDLVVDPVWGPWAETALACLKPGGRYLNVGAAGGDGTAFHVEWLRAAQLTLIGFSATRAEPADVIASYRHVAALAAAGSLKLPTAAYSLDEAAQAWQAMASSPGKKIVVIP
jgi:NADPH:quinone reductase-like Zn-dependent oxidoreductase